MYRQFHIQANIAHFLPQTVIYFPDVGYNTRKQLGFKERTPSTLLGLRKQLGFKERTPSTLLGLRKEHQVLYSSFPSLATSINSNYKHLKQ